MTKATAARPASGHPAKKRKRVSKRLLRITAWIAGVASFMSPWPGLARPPKPAGPIEPIESLVLIKEKIVKKRVVVWKAAPATTTVQYVYVAGPASSGSSGSSGKANPPATRTKGS